MRRGLFIALALLVAPLAARAQGKADTPEVPVPPPEEKERPPGGYPDLWVDVMMRRSWAELPPRWFAATTIDVGWVYLRPRLSLGYGRPHTKWVGFDINPTFTANALGAYAGLRLNLPRFNWRVGARYVFSLYRTYLDQQRNVDRLDFDLAENDRARVTTYETEIEGSVGVGPGDLIGLASLSYVVGVPEKDGQDLLVFEETLRVMVDPPLVWRARGGYLFHFGTKNQHSAGLVVDLLHVPDREDSITLRAGPVVRIVLSRRVEVRGSFVATISSPDSLGLAGSDFTEIGLRYRWASE